MEAVTLMIIMALVYLAFNRLQEMIRKIEQGLAAEARETRNHLKSLISTLEPLTIELGPVIRSILDKNKVGTMHGRHHACYVILSNVENYLIANTGQTFVLNPI